MADNVTAPGTGAVLAFDEVVINGVTVLVGRNKLGYGADGTYTEVVDKPSTEATLALIKAGVDLLHNDNQAVGPLPAPAGATYVDKSGTIATGGTPVVVAANANRRGFSIQNNSNFDMRVNAKAAASATAGILLPGGSSSLYEYPYGGVPLTAISIYCATAGAAFEASEW